MSCGVVVVGLGYVGLPLASRAGESGLVTTGYDVRAEVVEGLNAGESHVPDVSDATLATMLARGFTATGDASVIERADTVVICVPTGLSPERTPDLGAVRSAATTVARHLRPGTLVVLESTSYPGTTQDVVLPILESGSGLTAGEDFYLAYSPERIDPGNTDFGLANTPKVVSGLTPLCAKYCATFYGRFVESVVVAKGTREAELAKLLENTYRFVNIALVNEVTVFCERLGIDVWDVLRCAGTKPFGFSSFTPGPGVGGHCIPVDPLYLTSKASAEGFTFRTVEAAREVNDAMPAHVTRRAVALLDERGTPVADAQVLLLGVTYKPNASDVRESPAVPIAEALLALGARVRYHDPHVSRFQVNGRPLSAERDLHSALVDADLTILLQDHDCYDLPTVSQLAQTLFDTRGKSSGNHVELL